MELEFNRIYDLYSQDIYRLIYSYTLNTSESMDILQDTFLKLYKNINKLSSDDNQIKHWLVVVAINNSKDYLKSFWRKKQVFLDDLDAAADIKSADEIQDILLKLNKKYRLPLYLYYYEGYKINEISKILKISESAVKMRLSRAKELLKKEWREII